MTSRLKLISVSANVLAVQTVTGEHVGNLKRIGEIWKFKAVGCGADGAVEPGGGPLTGQHNTVFASPDADAVSARLAPHL